MYDLRENGPSGIALCKVRGLGQWHVTSPTISYMIGPIPRSVTATSFSLHVRVGTAMTSQKLRVVVIFSPVEENIMIYMTFI